MRVFVEKYDYERLLVGRKGDKAVLILLTTSGFGLKMRSQCRLPLTDPEGVTIFDPKASGLPDVPFFLACSTPRRRNDRQRAACSCSRLSFRGTHGRTVACTAATPTGPGSIPSPATRPLAEPDACEMCDS